VPELLASLENAECAKWRSCIGARSTSTTNTCLVSYSSYGVRKMRIAIPVSDGRISPVFDVARHFLFVDIEDRREVRRSQTCVEQPEPVGQARRVAQRGADALICGAISRPLETMLLAAGINVIPQTCGPVEDVLRAFISGELTEEAFVTPGCRGHRRRSDDGPVSGSLLTETEE